MIYIPIGNKLSTVTSDLIYTYISNLNRQLRLELSRLISSQTVSVKDNFPTFQKRVDYEGTIHVFGMKKTF